MVRLISKDNKKLVQIYDDYMGYRQYRPTLIDVLNDVRTQEALKGTYYNRWHILQAIYHSYLIGIGYTDFNWRDKNDSK